MPRRPRYSTLPRAAFDMAMETAMRPIGYARDVSVLHRIEMNVVDMAFKIRVITNRVLPIATLPDALLPLT